MKPFRILRALIATTLIISLFNCAKRSTPSGGPKDITPPAIISAKPENNTLNFSEDKIRISFNEYIKIKDLQKNLVVSPPLKYTPNIYPQGSASKYVDVEILDTLKENTTYVFNFGQSIVDNNESNPFSFFTYVFSTGDYIDSLETKGFVTDAVNKKADEFISVMLYEMDSTFNDSIIYKKPPTYITNTLDSATTFKLTNLKAGKYLMIALKDQANNYTFEPKSDKIGFLDQPLTIPNDTLYELKLFKEIPAFRATTPALLQKNKIAFGYEGDPEGMQIELISEKPADYRYRTVPDLERDSLYYYFTPFKADSLLFKVTNERFNDTFKVRIKDLYADSLNITQLNARNAGLHQKLKLHANIPIEEIDTNKINIINQDSTQIAFVTDFNKEENILNIDWEKEPAQRYSITLLPETFTDFYGAVNDTLNYMVNTKGLADLGSISVIVKNVAAYPIILQLTNDKGEVQYERFIEKATNNEDFRNINPGNYFLRVIHDANGNGIWDTGSFLERRQPERISYLPQVVELRPNWEIEQTFILE